MNYLESKYLSLVSARLRNYKKKSAGVAQFSCPICGDSERDKRRARGYVYSIDGRTMYHCHNCNATMSFGNMLKTIDQVVYDEFRLEKLQESKTIQQQDLEAFTAKMKRPVFMKEGPLRELLKVSQLKWDHPAKKFITSRMIPSERHCRLFWCPTFYAWSNTVIPGKFDPDLRDHGRIIIPFFDAGDVMHAFQGRSISPKSTMKYITLVNDETRPKLFGLDTVDWTHVTYVFEGPFDSMFIKNSVATAGGDLVSAMRDRPKRNLVIVYDNEPRSRETINKIDKAIAAGYNVTIWPESFTYKDVNDAVVAGVSADTVKSIIDHNTYGGLSAMAALTHWSRV